MLSLHARVLMAGVTVLVGFFGLAGLTLQQAFDHRAEIALQERMLGQVYVLISAFEQDEKGRVQVPDVWRESKFSMLNPGFLADIRTNEGDLVWQSFTMRSVPVPALSFQERNQSKLLYVRNRAGEQFALLRVAVAMNNNPAAQLFIFSIAENLSAYNLEASAFRRNLWLSLAGVAFVLLILQSQAIRWVLSPLKIAELELSAIESGRQESLKHEYPGELLGMTRNLNSLLVQQKENLLRYRHTLSDLAHSLKTPLAVLQTALDGDHDTPSLKSLLQQQIERMSQITEYQLSRAASAGPASLKAPEPVREISDKVIQSLRKVYQDKSIDVQIDVDESVVFHGDRGDLMEILGNLLDNAFKWARSSIRLSAHAQRDDTGQYRAEIRIEDDGPGIPEEQQARVFHRGARADENVAGHGIGLSIVNDIVKTYHGEIKITDSELGGAGIMLHLP